MTLGIGIATAAVVVAVGVGLVVGVGSEHLSLIAYNSLIHLYVVLPAPLNGSAFDLAAWVHFHLLPRYFLAP